MNTDVIADLLTRIRNASAVGKRIVEIPASKMKLGIIQVLYNMGYVQNYKLVPNEEIGQGVIKVALKYDSITKEPAISKLVRISKPGLRKYCDATEIPRVMNGLGIAILSTSKGIMTGKEAKLNNVGGEVLCYIY
jgi:small subunit ribosomal protein S8